MPSQPEQFEGVAISAFQIRLTWMMRDTEPQIIRYELYYNVSTSDMHKTITPTTDYVLDDLRPNTLYHIRLAARSETGEGASSPVITVRTQQSGEHRGRGRQRLFNRHALSLLHTKMTIFILALHITGLHCIWAHKYLDNYNLEI